MSTACCRTSRASRSASAGTPATAPPGRSSTCSSSGCPGEHHVIFSEVDGRFPNHHPDPTVEANLADLKRLVADKQLDFGIAFDGDGDRIGAVDGKGRVIWGDQLLMILAEAGAQGAARARRSSPTSRPARRCSTASPSSAASR